MTKSTSAFSVDEVLKASWEITKRGWRQFLWLGGMSLLAWIAFILVAIGLRALGLPRFIDSLVSCLLGIQVTIFMLRGVLAIVRDQKLVLADLIKFDGRMFLQVALATLLFYIVIMVGFILLIIPGIIASIMFGFYLFSAVDGHADAIPALEDSMHMTQGNKLKIFLFQIVFGLLGTVITGVPLVTAILIMLGLANADGSTAVIIIVGALACIVAALGLLIFSMMGMSSQAYMYLQMRAKTPLKIKD